MATGTTTGLALDEAALIALVTPGAVDQAAGSSAGSVDLSFSAASTAFDYLAQGQVLTLTYTVQVDDGDGGVTPQTLSSPLPAPTTRRRSWVKSIPPCRPYRGAAPAGPTVLARAST